MKLLLPLTLLLAAGCRPAPEPRTVPPSDSADAAYRQELEQWRRQRVERLKGPGGWLRLAGLFWLAEGPSSVGSAAESAIRLPGRAPAQLGTLTLEQGAVTLSVEPGVRATLQGRPVRRRRLASDADPGGPDRVHVGDFTLLIIRRGGRLALRLFDARAPTLRAFRGLDYFPVAPGWRVSARFLPYPEPRAVQVSTAIETTEEMTTPGELRFRVAGRELRLVPFAEAGSRELFVVFGDRTNGHQTYGGGRFLDAQLPPGRPDAGTRVELDFNRAHNPPCAFTPYATCPVPRVENRLPVAVTAGEQTYRGTGH